MFNTLYNVMASTRVAFEDFKQNPVAVIRELERGDADSSGSTLRTIGIVIVVIAVVSALGAAVISAAGSAGSSITTAADSANASSFNLP